MKRTSLLFLFVWPGLFGFSQQYSDGENLDKRISQLETKIAKMGQLKFSGYVQTQWTWNRADVSTGKQNDFSVRRGRLKTSYVNDYGEAVLQIDATENGVKVKDAYLQMQTPRIQEIALRGGIFNRPFGYEISYSSSSRESPERSRIFQTLFPKERDLGAELILKGFAHSLFQPFTLHIGLFSGNGGQAKETDSRKDVIGHLSYTKKRKNLSYALGVSLYAGGVRMAGDDQQKAYRLVDKSFVEDTGMKHGDYAQRRYYGFDGQVELKSSLGTTSLHGEYLWGTQPGAAAESVSPTGAITSNIYMREFNGYYMQFVQSIGKSKHRVVLKYDTYDPNTDLSKNACRTAGDIKYSTFGMGWQFCANQNVSLICYYEINSNENVNNSFVDGKYARNLKDDMLTLRLQYRFF